jgi:uncharacterized protein DUF3565
MCPTSMDRRIIGFLQDDEGHWVAELECGHRQHMRHRPPFENRAWVTSADGRTSRVGVEVNCKRCDEEPQR